MVPLLLEMTQPLAAAVVLPAALPCQPLLAEPRLLPGLPAEAHWLLLEQGCAGLPWLAGASGDTAAQPVCAAQSAAGCP